MSNYYSQYNKKRISEFLKLASPSEKKVLSVIKKGKENALTVSTVANLVKLSSRQVQEIIRNLRSKYGFYIGSSIVKPSGYYIIQNEEEFWETVNLLESSAKNRLAISKKMKQTYNQTGGKFDNLPHFEKENGIQLSFGLLIKEGKHNEAKRYSRKNIKQYN